MAKRKKSNPTALIDGDILLYHVVEDSLEEEAIRGTDEWHYVVDMASVRAEFETRAKAWAIEAGCGSNIVIALGSLSNWRKRVMPDYKRNRSKRKPLGYVEAERWVVEESEFETAMRMHLEADDVIGLAATNNWFGEAVIVSNDKDMLTIPGHVYNPVTAEHFSTSPSAAFERHMIQTLTGDPTDGYAGCKGIGAVKATAIVCAAMPDRKKVWRGVVEAFEKAGMTEDDALMNARVARILQHDDYVDAGKRKGRLTLWSPP